MSITFGDLKTQVSRDIRDPNNLTFTTTEVGDLVNEGISEASAVRPQEWVSPVTALAPATTLSISTFGPPAPSDIYRVDVYAADGVTFLYVMPTMQGTGPLGGWELHANTIYTPPSPFVTPANVQLWGYAPYKQLSADSDTTDLDTDGINLMRAFCQYTLLGRLRSDRSAFQQWQQQSNATDTSLVWLFREEGNAFREYTSRRNQMRRIRKRA